MLKDQFTLTKKDIIEIKSKRQPTLISNNTD